MYKEFINWRQTKQGALIGAAVEIAISYIFFSWAIDNGSLLTYAVAFFFLYDAVKLFIRAVTPQKKSTNVKNKKPSRSKKKT